MKLGLIDYSNSHPFLEHFQRVRWPSLEIVSGIPSKLNHALASGELHMSAISTFELLRCPDAYWILPEWSINSKGQVRSVALFSKEPWATLERPRIALTSHSATSVHLLKSLLADDHIEAMYGDENMADPDAILLIGDPALRFADPRYPHAVDLAERWTSTTQTPMVFALMGIRKEAMEAHHQDILRVANELNLVREELSQGLGERQRSLELAFPDITMDFAIYFSGLDFSLDDACRRGLLRFAQALAQHRYITPLSALPFAPL